MPIAQFRRISVALMMAAALAPAAAAEEMAPTETAPAAMAPAARGELGARYWLSTGETKISHNAQGSNPAFGNPTSILTYENLDANSFELFGRTLLGRNWFLKGLVGVGRVNTGSLDDEDYLRGQVKFSDTTSSITEGWLGYGSIDVGHQWVLKQGAVNLGVFGGFSQWTEEYAASGATATVGTINIDNSIKVITYNVRWRALRVGFNGQFTFGRLRLGVDVAAVPYAQFYAEDSHHLRGDLGPVPNIIDSGEGYGVQAEAELRYEIFRRTELGVGLRYWHLEANSGTSDFRHFSNGETPIVEFYSQRTGVTISLRHLW
jgi:hypothetical protein